MSQLPTIAMAKVWNDGDKDWIEEFRGEQVKIPAKGHVMMNLFDATQFKGQYSPIIRDGLGNDLRPKRIRVERIADGGEVIKVPEHVCMSCGKDFENSEILQAHIYSSHKEQMVDQDAKKKLERKNLKSPKTQGPALE